MATINKLNKTVVAGERTRATDFNAVSGKVDELVQQVNTNTATFPQKADVNHTHGTSDINGLSSAISTAIATKQDKLTAGKNITIENNVISASGVEDFVLHSNGAYISGKTANGDYKIKVINDDHFFVDGHEAIVILNSNAVKRTFTSNGAQFVFEDEDYLTVKSSLFNGYDHVEIFIEPGNESEKYTASFNVISGATVDKLRAIVKAGDTIPVKVTCNNGKAIDKWTWISAEGSKYTHSSAKNPPMPNHNTTFNIYTKSVTNYEIIVEENSRICGVYIETAEQSEDFSTFPAHFQIGVNTALVRLDFSTNDETYPITSVKMQDDYGRTIYTLPVTHSDENTYEANTSGVTATNSNLHVVPIFEENVTPNMNVDVPAHVTIRWDGANYNGPYTSPADNVYDYQYFTAVADSGYTITSWKVTNNTTGVITYPTYTEGEELEVMDDNSYTISVVVQADSSSGGSSSGGSSDSGSTDSGSTSTYQYKFYVNNRDSGISNIHVAASDGRTFDVAKGQTVEIGYNSDLDIELSATMVSGYSFYRWYKGSTSFGPTNPLSATIATRYDGQTIYAVST